MAVARQTMCNKCSRTYTTYSTDMRPDICSVCTQKDKDWKEKAHFDKLDKLSIEERIRKLEKWTYHHKCVNVNNDPFKRY
ncbi:MAG: hypothetical protein JRJ00_00765 [Deltaproteobacteria bacterium]|nr:hypothetical protein [Deltaproteobacteria bacterium]